MCVLFCFCPVYFPALFFACSRLAPQLPLPSFVTQPLPLSLLQVAVAGRQLRSWQAECVLPPSLCWSHLLSPLGLVVALKQVCKRDSAPLHQTTQLARDFANDEGGEACMRAKRVQRGVFLTLRVEHESECSGMQRNLQLRFIFPYLSLFNTRGLAVRFASQVACRVIGEERRRGVPLRGMGARSGAAAPAVQPPPQDGGEELDGVGGGPGGGMAAAARGPPPGAPGLDELLISLAVTTKLDPEGIPGEQDKRPDGAALFVHGLSLEGARWPSPHELAEHHGAVKMYVWEGGEGGEGERAALRGVLRASSRLLCILGQLPAVSKGALIRVVN